MIDLSEHNVRRIAARNSISVTNFLLAIVDLNVVPPEELPHWIYNHSAVRHYRNRNYKNYFEIEYEAQEARNFK